MPHPAADRWNTRYDAEGEQWLARQPRQLLIDYAHFLPPTGLALDAACGVATNGLFLAQRGLRVIALDISEIALRLAKRRAESLTLPIFPAVYDLADPWLPPEIFDVILNFHFLERGTFPVYQRALKAGGILIFETFLQTGEDILFPDYYLTSGELVRAFQDFEILHSTESPLPGIEKVTSQLVARKPNTLNA